MIRLLFIALLLAGCVNLDKADRRVETVESRIFKVEYTEQEQQIIRDAITAYGKFRDDWRPFLGAQFVLLKEGQMQLMADFENLKIHYLKVYEIIEQNFDKYDQATQAQLLEDDKTARKLAKDVERLQTVSEVANYAEVLLRMSARLL